MLVTSFVAQDLVALAPALVIVLGADVGTALMARILTFDLSAVAAADFHRCDLFPWPQADPGRAAWPRGHWPRADSAGAGTDCAGGDAYHPANGVQVIFASLTGDIMLDALIGAVFAIISYSSGRRAADGHAHRRGRDLLPGGAVSGDRR